jgi:hypothetical protein
MEELASGGGPRDSRLRGFECEPRTTPSHLQTCCKHRIKTKHTMDDMDVNQQEVDPLSDPEERRVLYSALDSFR